MIQNRDLSDAFVTRHQGTWCRYFMTQTFNANFNELCAVKIAIYNSRG